MKFIKFLKKLFCTHEYKVVSGTGVYQKKNRGIISIPVIKLHCNKCGYEKITLDYSRPARIRTTARIINKHAYMKVTGLK